MKITGEIIGLESTQKWFGSLSDRIRQELRTEMEFVVSQLAQHVVTEKLSGQALNSVSGRLAGSIGGDVQDEGPAVVGTVWARTPYAGIQEYGGRTRAHDIFPRAASALHFFANGDEVFAAHVRHPGSKMPERSYLRSSLFDLHDQIMQDLTDAVMRGAMK